MKKVKHVWMSLVLVASVASVGFLLADPGPTRPGTMPPLGQQQI